MAESGSQTVPEIEITIGTGDLDAIGSPAALLAQDGEVLTASRSFSQLKRFCDGTRVDETIRDLLGRALKDATPVLDTLDRMDQASGQELSFDVILLPQADAGRVLLIARNKSLEASLKTALVESRSRYKDLVEISSDFAWETDQEGRFVFLSHEGVLGFDARDLIGRPSMDLMASELNALTISPFVTPAKVVDQEVWLAPREGEARCFMATAVPLFNRDEVWSGARGICRDVTENKRRDAELVRSRNQERVFSRILRTFRGEIDPENTLKVAASTTCHGLAASGVQIFMLRTPLAKVGPPMAFDLVASFGITGSAKLAEQALNRLKLSDQRTKYIDLSLDGWSILAAGSWHDDQMNGAILLWRDQGRTVWPEDEKLLFYSIANQVGIAIEQISHHRQLVEKSRTDPLTGLLNRRAFYEEVSRRYNRLLRGKTPAALIYVDLDNFKAVNDTYGHDRGDEVLMLLRDILYNNTRSVDLVARLGGDEFAVWLENADEEIATRKAETFLAAGKALNMYSASADRPLDISLGVAVYHPGSHEDLSDFVSRADEAMLQVKRTGKRNYRLSAQPGQAAPRGDTDG